MSANFGPPLSRAEGGSYSSDTICRPGNFSKKNKLSDKLGGSSEETGREVTGDCQGGEE